ncbi:MAG: nucleoside recognition protein [Clostridiales bacterium]|jgi:spore maturation protein A|nr:nucleoside recognition protein [Clostridiales bacterium]
MNALFFLIIVISLGILTVVAPDSVLSIMIDGGKSALDLSLKMIAIYSVWLAVLKLVEKTELDKKITSLFEPIVSFLYKDENKKAKAYITMNMTANLLGMGSAATPLGIKAINTMNRDLDKDTATPNMIMFFVLNATSLQLIPATVIALRAAAGSAAPADILIPNIITSVVSALSGFAFVKIISYLKRKRKTKAS